MKPSLTWADVLSHNAWQALLLLDQLLGLLASTAAKEQGWADLTLSANAYRWYLSGKRLWPCVWIDRLFFWQESHCMESYRYEIERRHLPESMRNS